jgi:hypothetical protein
MVNAGVAEAVWTVLLPFSIRPTWLALGSVEPFLKVSSSTMTLGVMPP